MKAFSASQPLSLLGLLQALFTRTINFILLSVGMKIYFLMWMFTIIVSWNIARITTIEDNPAVFVTPVAQFVSPETDVIKQPMLFQSCMHRYPQHGSNLFMTNRNKVYFTFLKPKNISMTTQTKYMFNTTVSQKLDNMLSYRFNVWSLKVFNHATS